MVSTRISARIGGSVAVIAGVAAPVLAGCGVTDIPRAPRTVTVYVPGPNETGTPVTTSSSVATVKAPPSPSTIPTSLAAGRQRGAPHSFAEAKARVDAAHAAAGVSSAFQSPTGNIACMVGGDPSTLAACEIERGRITPPLPSICPPDGPQDIGRIELSDKGARPVCNSDTIREGSAPPLGYGSRTDPSLGSVACLSEEFGMTCIDGATQHGFFIARDTFVTF